MFGRPFSGSSQFERKGSNSGISRVERTLSFCLRILSPSGITKCRMKLALLGSENLSRSVSSTPGVRPPTDVDGVGGLVHLGLGAQDLSGVCVHPGEVALIGEAEATLRW